MCIPTCNLQEGSVAVSIDWGNGAYLYAHPYAMVVPSARVRCGALTSMCRAIDTRYLSNAWLSSSAVVGNRAVVWSLLRPYLIHPPISCGVKGLPPRER